MSLTDDLVRLKHQEETLQFTRFDETTAWQLGAYLHRHACERSLPLIVDVRRFDRPLFLATTPGVTSDSVEWIRRKSNTVERFLRSSYRLKYQLALEKQDITQRYFLSPADYASAGGGFPISIQGTGVIGSVSVSGLPERADHQLIVEALCALLGHDPIPLMLGEACPFSE